MPYVAIVDIQVCWVGSGTGPLSVATAQSVQLNVPNQYLGGTASAANLSTLANQIGGAVSSSFTGTVQAQIAGFASGSP